MLYSNPNPYSKSLTLIRRLTPTEAVLLTHRTQRQPPPRRPPSLGTQPSPTAHPGMTDPVLRANTYLEVMDLTC